MNWWKRFLARFTRPKYVERPFTMYILLDRGLPLIDAPWLCDEQQAAAWAAEAPQRGYMPIRVEDPNRPSTWLDP